MKTHPLSFLAVSVVTVTASLLAAPPAQPIVPTKYLTGTICRDVAAALKKGKVEHKPVWIVAWDSKFAHSSDGLKGDRTDYALKWFYDNPETKKMVAENCIQVFTTLNNPVIAEWVNPADKTHLPVYIVLDANGKMVASDTHFLNPKDAIHVVEKILAKLNAAAPTTAAK